MCTSPESQTDLWNRIAWFQSYIIVHNNNFSKSLDNTKCKKLRRQQDAAFSVGIPGFDISITCANIHWNFFSLYVLKI